MTAGVEGLYAIDNQGTTWVECATVLRNVMAGQRPEAQEQRAMLAAIGADLIVREEQKKACPTCGTPRVDFSYWRVTWAGRLLINALAESLAA